MTRGVRFGHVSVDEAAGLHLAQEAGALDVGIPAVAVYDGAAHLRFLVEGEPLSGRSMHKIVAAAVRDLERDAHGYALKRVHSEL